MLTRDRPEYARRAVECFRAQTYVNKCLVVYDTAKWPALTVYPRWPAKGFYHHVPREVMTIGALRNEAIRFAIHEAFPLYEMGNEIDIISHLDDDDYSRSNRISEQVALLQSSGVDCVGYREMLFWREPDKTAWLYSNGDKSSCLGTSLCYWRKAWEKRPFSERNGANPRTRGEDREFCRGLRCLGVSSIQNGEPRMIARIHSGNAANYPVEALSAGGPHWKRAAEWDERVKEIME